MRRALFVSIVFASLAAGSCAYAEEIGTSNEELIRRLAALENSNAKLEKEIAVLRRLREVEATHAKLEGEKAALRGRTHGYENNKQFASIEPNATAATASYASATNMPTKAPAAIGPENPYYFWLDGMYDRIRLPTYQLGYHNIGGGAGGSDLGPVQTFDPSLNGGGVRGAIGYVMPGTSTKFEFGGSYVEAKASQSQSPPISNSVDVVSQFISGGILIPGFICVVPNITCMMVGTLKTDYSAWQLNGRVSDDWKYGSVTVTPSLAVFGGNTRVDQTLSQSFSFLQISGIQGAYSASTTESWRDIGARIGVDVSAPVTTALTVRLGGWVGGANRITFLSGNDVGTQIGSVIFNSTLSTADSKNVLLANAETGFAYQLAQMVALRGFAGLNYDGSVPGIASPSYTGTLSGTPTSTTAASIYYAHETSYYAGGGVAVKW